MPNIAGTDAGGPGHNAHGVAVGTCRRVTLLPSGIHSSKTKHTGAL